MKRRKLRLLYWLLPTLSLLIPLPARGQDLALWYTTPAQTWMTQALPIGNGRLGGMVFGDALHEHIQFNEDTLWSGRPVAAPKFGAEHLQQIQSLLASGNTDQVDSLMKRYFSSNASGAYQPLGDILIDFPASAGIASDYSRSLDLARGVASVHYVKDGVTYDREYFCSHPDRAMVLHFASSKRGNINFQIRLTTPQKQATVAASSNLIALIGRLPDNGLRFEAAMLVRPEGGSVSASGNQLIVTNADSATVLLTAATEYRAVYPTYRGNDYSAFNEEVLKDVGQKSYADLLAAHEKDYTALFGRVRLNLGTAPPRETTDQRLAGAAHGKADPALDALFFQFGRYLLISSSRDSLPSNRQGLWNDSPAAPWGADFPTMMNLEMMYWPAETTNLAECTQPLVQMIQGLVQPGTETARSYFGTEGWAVNYTTTPWGFTAAGRGPYTFFPAGAAWLCQHLWEHYDFSRDEAFLRDTVYPIMKQAARMWVEHLVAEPDGTLVSSPSESPEHGDFVVGAEMDEEIVRDLFSHCIEAEKILDVDSDLQKKLIDMREHLAPLKIGHRGQLQEWLEDIDAPTDTHRHISHLWALYPGDQISPIATPPLAAAARKTLAERGEGGVGWGLAWKIGFWARLDDGDHAYKILRELMTPTTQTNPRGLVGGTYANLFTARPPLQVDGSLAATAAMAEMLLQSQGGPIQLLPALPGAWADGSVSGLRARGGFVVDETWSNGKLTDATIHSTVGGNCTIRYGQKTIELQTAAGGSYPVAAAALGGG